MMGLRHLLADERGQASVELAVLMPVVIALAAVMVNSLMFMGSCASFDRQARNVIRTYACSPSAGQDQAQILTEMTDALSQSLDASYESCRVSCESVSGGHMRYTATLDFAPHLFGLELKDEIFGVSLPHVTHDVQLVVDAYKPGVLI